MTINTTYLHSQLGIIRDELNKTYAQVGESKPQIKETLAFLYNGLLDANGNQLPRLDYKTINDATITTGDLVAMLTQQIAKTQDQVLQLSVQMARSQNSRHQARQSELAQKLQESWQKQQEAEDLAKTMEIVKWVIFALALAATLVMACAMPMAIPGLLVSTVFTLFSVIPCDDAGTTITDKWTKAMSDSLYKTCIVEPMRDKLKEVATDLDVDAMDDDAVVTAFNDRGLSVTGVVNGSVESQKAFSQYFCMVLVIAMQLTVTIGTGVVVGVIGDKVNATSSVVSGVGSGVTTGIISGVGTGASLAASAATTAASTAATQITTEAVKTTSRSVLQAALQIAKQILDKAQRAAQAIKPAAELASATAQIGGAGGKIRLAVMKADAEEAKAQVQAIKAVIAYLQKLIESDQEHLAELIAVMSEPQIQVRQLLAREHAMNKNIIRAQLNA